MRNSILLISIFLLGMLACKKDEPAPDLSSVCDKGGIWLIDKKDSFNPNPSLDTFAFKQGGGYHRFVFTNSDVNRLQIDVLTKPDSGQTFIYKSIFVREISGQYISDPFTYPTMMDSMLTIRNNGSHYLVSIKPIKAKIGTSRTIELRACDLRMNDVTP
jgi:hypothetical protein